MAQTITSLTVQVDPSVPLVPRITRPDPARHPDWVGDLGASLDFGSRYSSPELSFAYGYQAPTDVLLAIDHLANALAELRALVAAEIPIADGVEFVGTVDDFLAMAAPVTPDDGDHFVRSVA